MRVVFFEKPGCISNSKQKKLLRNAGLELEVYSLLDVQWNYWELARFFEKVPLKDCFNPNAPRIKSNQIIPSEMSRREAIEAMIDDPLLIKRPLMIAEGRKIVGFDIERLKAIYPLMEWHSKQSRDDIEQCSQPQLI